MLKEIITNKERTVLLEQNAQRIELCKEVGDILYIQGDATEYANLLLAGIKKAAGIVIALPQDKETVYVTMSARMLNVKTPIKKPGDPLNFIFRIWL